MRRLRCLLGAGRTAELQGPLPCPRGHAEGCSDGQRCFSTASSSQGRRKACPRAQSLSCVDSLRPRGLKPTGSSVRGSLRARTPECVAMPSSRGSPNEDLNPCPVLPALAGFLGSPGERHTAQKAHFICLYSSCSFPRLCGYRNR